MMRNLRLCAFALLLTSCLASAQASQPALKPPTKKQLAKFEAEVRELLDARQIPGASAGIVFRQELVWSSGFGFADVENQIPVTADTPFELASVSKPFASILLMQLIEAGQLKPDDPMSKFDVPQWYQEWDGPKRYKEAPVLVRHVWSHTSQGTPGNAYSYNGNIYHDLTYVFEAITHKPYTQALEERIFRPLGMSRTVPGLFAPRFEPVLADIAHPYKLEHFKIAPGMYSAMTEPSTPDMAFPFNVQRMVASPASEEWRKKALGDSYIPLTMGSAAGLISCVTDLAKFDAALDRNTLISESSKQLMWTPMVSNQGKTLPYALGWFVQTDGDHRIVWHYGLFPPSYSTLYIKVPEKQITFILLANMDRVTSGNPVGRGDIKVSPFARTFLSLIDD